MWTRSTVATIAISIPIAPVAIPGRRRAPRFRFVTQPAPLAAGKNLPLIHPALDSDHAVGRVGLTETVVDIGAQGMQRKLPLQVPLRARDFRAIQTPRHANLDSLAPKTQSGVDSLPHRPSKSHALFKLQRDRFADQLRVQLRLVNFLNVDEDLTLGLLRQILLQLFDLRALAADDDARS